jgi:hypothetical protein
MLDEPALMTRIGSCIDFKSTPVVERHRAAPGIVESILERQLARAAWPHLLDAIEYFGAEGAAYILTNRRAVRVEWVSHNRFTLR